MGIGCMTRFINAFSKKYEKLQAADSLWLLQTWDAGADKLEAKP
jgi:hypothetical protein